MIRGMAVGQDGVIAHFKRIPPQVYGEVRQAVLSETFNIVRLAKLKVSGPVLRNRTGHLRQGINAQFEESETSIIGSAGINSGKAKYPAVHEFGGTFTIREHQRRLTQVFGRPVKSIRMITVREHEATFPERSYLRSTLRENAGRIRKNIKAANRRGLQA